MLFVINIIFIYKLELSFESLPLKIKKDDGLPQIVCMRCLGTLEFMCDFYKRCHDTQQELLETSQNGTAEKFQQENEEESDKENSAPSPKRKTKVSSNGSKNKSCLTENNVHCKTEKKSNSDSPRYVDNNDCENDVPLVTETAIVLNNVDPQKQATIESTVIHEKKSKNDKNNGTKLKYKRSSVTKKEDISKKAIRMTRSLSMNDSMNLLQKDETNVNASLENPVRRKRGRKSKLEKMREASLLLNGKREMENDIDNKNCSNDCKRYCLRAVCTNNKFNIATNSNVILSKSQVEQIAAKEQVTIDSSSNEIHAKDDEANTVRINDAVSDELTEIKSNESSKTVDNSLKKMEDSLIKSKAISVIVKQEKEGEGASPRANGKLNQLTWIPNEMLSQRNENLMESQSQNQKDQQKTEILQANSSLGDKIISTEDNRANLTIEHNVTIHSHLSDHSDTKPKVFTEQNRVTVIKLSQLKDTIIPKMVQEDSIELCAVTDTMNQSRKSDSDSNLAEQPLSQRLSQERSFIKNKRQRKSKDKSFGKISELISDEQKQAIEAYYTVDMSIVNSEEVQKNITIVDKKNIRCNICGILYLRMDKCQVHIWGHLQMKPYQCKACDFATVTVTNVRCHIRKSHLKIKPFACHLCEKRYVTAVLLEEHINTHTGARPYKCKLCDFSTSRRQMLSYHSSTHKATKDVNCKICGKEFYSRGRLRAHMIVHNKDKVVVCKLCSAYLSNAEALETHNRNIHMQDYVCNICGKHVKSRKALHNHQNVHSAAKYKCSLCPNVYKSSQILREHILKHKGIRNYKCNICEKTFAQQSHLAAHMAVHSKIRFHCPGCDKPFNRHDNMKIHTKRCKIFLAKPELKNCLIKRERSTSFSKITELSTDVRNRETANCTSLVENQKDEILVRTANDQEKSGMNICKLGLNISCIESTDKTWDRNDLYEKTGEVARATEINVIQITNVHDKLIPENGNLTVLENVLRPESF